jgi:hypothetical protein
MAKKGAKKQAAGWTATTLMEADLKKVKKGEEGRILGGICRGHLP